MLWDLAGEDSRSQVQTSYLRGAAGYFLIVDGTWSESLVTALSIHKRAVEAVGDIPCMLVVNKSDLWDKWQISGAGARKNRERGVEDPDYEREERSRSGRDVSAAYGRGAEVAADERGGGRVETVVGGWQPAIEDVSGSGRGPCRPAGLEIMADARTAGLRPRLTQMTPVPGLCLSRRSFSAAILPTELLFEHHHPQRRQIEQTANADGRAWEWARCGGHRCCLHRCRRRLRRCCSAPRASVLRGERPRDSRAAAPE